MGSGTAMSLRWLPSALNTATRPPCASATHTEPSLATFSPSGTRSSPSEANFFHGPTEPSGFTS